MRKFPKFYGGTIDPETGALYDARRPSQERKKASPSEQRRRKEQRKRAREARKKNR